MAADIQLNVRISEETCALWKRFIAQNNLVSGQEADRALREYMSRGPGIQLNLEEVAQ